MVERGGERGTRGGERGRRKHLGDARERLVAGLPEPIRDRSRLLGAGFVEVERVAGGQSLFERGDHVLWHRGHLAAEADQLRLGERRLFRGGIHPAEVQAELQAITVDQHQELQRRSIMGEALSVEDDVKLVIGGTGLILQTAKVIAQRQFRPMAGHKIASEDIKRVLGLGEQNLLLHVEAAPERLTTADLPEQNQQAGRQGEVARQTFGADGEAQLRETIEDRRTQAALEFSGGRQATRRLLASQRHHLLRREGRTVVDQVVIGRDPVALDDLPGAEADERLFDVGAGDGGEIHGRQSAPRPARRKPASYI